jgi:hypothetical protein
MLERRVRSGMEVVDFTGVVLVYSWRGGRGLGWIGLTLLCKCFLVVEDILEFSGQVQYFAEDEVGEIECPLCVT